MSDASFCWLCGGKLVPSHFAEVTDRQGNVLRVHKVCKGDSQTLLHPITAEESDRPPDLRLAEERP